MNNEEEVNYFAYYAYLIHNTYFHQKVPPLYLVIEMLSSITFLSLTLYISRSDALFGHEFKSLCCEYKGRIFVYFERMNVNIQSYICINLPEKMILEYVRKSDF